VSAPANILVDISVESTSVNPKCKPISHIEKAPPARGIGLKISRSHANVIYASLRLRSPSRISTSPQQTPRGMRYIVLDRKLLFSQSLRPR
jgi:hypothetical protein